MLKLLCGSQQTVENSSRDGSTRLHYLTTEKFVCRSRSNKSDVEQWTGSKLGKESIKAVYCHSAYLTYMQSNSLSDDAVNVIRVLLAHGSGLILLLLF